MTFLNVLQVAASLFMLVAVALPFIRNNYWVFRILEYPRFQKFLLCLGILATWIPTFESGNTLHRALVTGLAAASIYLLYKVLPYTRFSRKEMRRVRAGSDGNDVSLFAANVYEKNRQYEKLLAQVRSCDADIVFLVETDSEWTEAVKELESVYPYSLKKPLENTYGLLLYSKLKIVEGSVKHLVEPDVPSIEMVVSLRSGQNVKVFGLHPKPPVPGEDERSTAKDRELMKVAFKAVQSEHPVIVMGDLNDVAWSYTTELFRKTSRLLDPRRGRGFYSTFNAKNVFMRFPLDYVFCSNDFGLVKMKRMPRNGSDHFAMFIHLRYDATLKRLQRRPQPAADEKLAAANKAAGKEPY